MTTSLNDTHLWQSGDYLRLAICFFPAAILTWGIHESAHWLMGEALGYDMWITFNQVGLVQGDYSMVQHQILVSMAGPVVTWLQVAVAFLLSRRSRTLWLYAFLYLAFWTRAIAMIISLLMNPNDEARVSLLLGLPLWVVPAISVALVFIPTYLASRRLAVGWKGNLIAYAMASLVTTLVVFSDQLLFFAN